jgi:hypothetical protein
VFVVLCGTCGTASHIKKGFVVGDAYYIPAKGSSALHWLFIKNTHLKRSGRKTLLSSFASTEEHVEAIHSVYDAHPEFLEELVMDPPLRALLGLPLPSSTASV